MRKWRFITTAGMFVAIAGSIIAHQRQQPEQPKGFRLEDHTWPEAETLLRPETVVVIPLGAAASEHGPHLKLRNDVALAEYFARRLLQTASIVVAPTLTYHYYPAFVEYPGSTTLSLETARELTAGVVRSLSTFGPRRFYLINTSLSAHSALEPAARTLASEGVLLTFTDFSTRLAQAAQGVRQQIGGAHADEIETSMMLYIDPSIVDMSRAVRDFTPSRGPFRLTRDRQGEGTYSPTGISGDPTLATPAKGRWIVEALVSAIASDIEKLHGMTPPSPATRSVPAPAASPSVAVPPGSDEPRTCTAGDQRTIRGIGDAYTYWWSNANAEELAALWAPQGDMVHPDGMIERGRHIIMQNRTTLFVRREYRGSKHPLTINVIRCLSYDIAVADAKWELRAVRDSSGKETMPFEGLATLVVRRGEGRWVIEAYRYSLKPSSAQPPPMWFKRPGIPGGG